MNEKSYLFLDQKNAVSELDPVMHPENIKRHKKSVAEYATTVVFIFVGVFWRYEKLKSYVKDRVSKFEPRFLYQRYKSFDL